jgi:hypothetical protein
MTFAPRHRSSKSANGEHRTSQAVQTHAAEQVSLQLRKIWASRKGNQFLAFPFTKFERADNGERRTTQVPQLDAAEQTGSTVPGSLFRVALATWENPGPTDRP